MDSIALKYKCILAFDFLGFGLSDKPKDYTYSIDGHANFAEIVFKHFGIKGGNALAHDMGDSVLTELISRQLRKEFNTPDFTGFLSATFTNGNMIMEKAKLRVNQVRLLDDTMGPFLSYLGTSYHFY